MRFSIWGQTNQSWADLLDIAQYADDGTWRAFYAADHFMSHADTAEERTDFHEATALFAALAAATSRIRLAPLVLSMTFRHPAVLANWAATVDHVSQGRFTLGLGPAGRRTSTNATASSWVSRERESTGFPKDYK